MKVPSEVYDPSPRPYRGLCEVDYPFHDWTVTVRPPGHNKRTRTESSQGEHGGQRTKHGCDSGCPLRRTAAP
jgi:hypothetical protein